MITRKASAQGRERTIARARAIRDGHAMEAAFTLNRVHRARGAARYSAVVRWPDEYQRFAARCRLLGEMIRARRAAA